MSLLIEALKRAEQAKNQPVSSLESHEETLSLEIPDEPLSLEETDDLLILDNEPVSQPVSSIISEEKNYDMEWLPLENLTDDPPPKIVEKEPIKEKSPPTLPPETNPKSPTKSSTTIPPSEEPLSRPWTTEDQDNAAAQLQAASDSASLKPLLGYILLLVVMIMILGGGYFYISQKVEEYSKSPYAGNLAPLPAGGLAAKLAELQKKNQSEQTPPPVQSPQIEQTIPNNVPASIESSDKKLPEKIVPEPPAKIEEKTTPSKNKRLKIEHNTDHKQTDQRLQQAYQFYQQGHYNRAKKQYQSILQNDEHNRDALLGMAAIAVQNQQVEQARYYYQQLLRFYPKDSFAEAGLINLQDDTPEAENMLKNQITNEPESGYLQFVLGNFYSRQGRWNEAQQAYFEAYRKNNQHPDYAYNLAVSLDQLSKDQAALPYYQRALMLSNHHQATFNLQTVKQRINEIENK
ncbi:MAG: hypothetical protein RIT27_2225 [Pseudomonadota bacterium]|jgi:tetratricopeptide (TPR) repeat protein